VVNRFSTPPSLLRANSPIFAPASLQESFLELVESILRVEPGVLVPIPTFPVAVFTKKAGTDPVAIFKLPQTSSFESGDVVPIPTFPAK
jgi:hypothetical protein